MLLVAVVNGHFVHFDFPVSRVVAGVVVVVAFVVAFVAVVVAVVAVAVVVVVAVVVSKSARLDLSGRKWNERLDIIASDCVDELLLLVLS